MILDLISNNEELYGSLFKSSEMVAFHFSVLQSQRKNRLEQW